MGSLGPDHIPQLKGRGLLAKLTVGVWLYSDSVGCFSVLVKVSSEL